MICERAICNDMWLSCSLAGKEKHVGECFVEFFMEICMGNVVTDDVPCHRQSWFRAALLPKVPASACD